ncbi:ditrans,polycis-undaprenyl-diphosphate synthase [Jeotgalibacillus alimentarius]|uniref:Isoprenyl transferase n=1 Tax=Jeotgalibacillus alimentarius TaxID=135826 RepID=A0A0C2W370_9BACL|nr:isoprenyl transferase [Jeotgalibacillus alimentarius]KIL50503.1 ditrans,polycis-undaprenyl-diphosphate synthase [Jeotgalibacillus alimentarius]
MLEKMKRWTSLKEPDSLSERISECKNYQIPEHIAIIMDGNGRWANKRALPRVAGHHEGMKTVKPITRLASELGVKALTLYAFSTENWVRPKVEVEFLMKLPEEFLGTFLPELIEENVQVQMMGDRAQVPVHTLKAVDQAIEKTANNDGLVLNFALNYGSRNEILQAVKAFSIDVKEGKKNPEELNDDIFSSYLMTPHLGDPDLLIRTSGEIRLSNFMLWQLAYTEFWFTDVLWPDFKGEHLIEAIEGFQKRSRRFGGLKSEDVT